MAAIYVQAPEMPAEALPRPYIFLAGGIAGCHEWQTELSALLRDLLPRGTVFNPRRAQYDWLDARAKEEQITWEFRRLWDADIISFWFCQPTENPTTLFEFGTHFTRRHCSADQRPLILPGVQPGYKKEKSIRLQMRLLDPKLQVSASLEDLARRIVAAAEKF